MAVPTEKTVADMTGQYILNRGLSDDTNKLLELQGVGWLLRKALAIATVTIKMKHTGESIHIVTTLSGGIKGSVEDLALNDTFADRDDNVWGEFIVKCRKTTADDATIEDEFIKEGFAQKDVLLVTAINAKNEWTAIQTWGFEDVKGERRYVRRVRLEHKKGIDHFHIVYDFTPLSS